MQRGRSGRDEFFGFGDPFGGFGGFGRPGSLISSFFGGRDPFDDPFFTQPFGGMMGPSFFGGPSVYGAERSPFGDPMHGGFLEDQAAEPKKSNVPIIQELSSDDEVDERERGSAEKEASSGKQSRLGKEPSVQEPDEEIDDKKGRLLQQEIKFKGAGPSKPQTRSYSFHSSTVTCGGLNGAYYTSSTTRRTGGDGVTVEESREADTTTGKATHRLSRGLGGKGHSIARKLNSDGRVDTVQTLHNLDEDELVGFEEAWKGNARMHLPGWNQGLDTHGDAIRGGGSAQAGQPSRGWALPAAEQQHYTRQQEPQAHPHRSFSRGP